MNTTPLPTWITESGFAPFGTLVRHTGQPERHYLDMAFEDIAPQVRPRLWINSLNAAPQKITFAQIERHPFSPQSFLPLSAAVLLMAACPSKADGTPDTGKLRAFLLPPGTGIIYKRGVWHHGLLSPHGTCNVAVLMGQGDDQRDTEEYTLPTPLYFDRDTLPHSQP
ncbi:ureidoglycolate lyase [Puniceibacterium sp. IMCC21224]|uniref:ureidoglycolate lyase n=1 Tax=Puniceibacterium sp. IMCC21224 TaxID=1618204 RepID=UPI00064DA3A8|nr:ureidoglycolate lyase [Puniceibacterium sp. IMCC21224]KMK66535.1 ureidoglycolate hydrolase [Puniceibacterium sp. IMCC21224]